MPKRRTVTRYSNECNVKNIVLNQLFYGDKDAFINYIMHYLSVEMYEGEIGYVHCSLSTIPFDFNNSNPDWDDKVFYEKLKHSKAYFRKSRD